MQLKKPIDSGEKLKSSTALDYLWFNWRIIGMHPTTSYRQLYIFYSVLSNLFCACCLPASLLINLQNIENLEQLIANLSLSVTIVMATLKQYTILYWRKSLLNVNHYLDKLDERCNAHVADRMYILEAIRTCHVFYVAYMINFGMCAMGLSSIGIRNHQLVYVGWFPRFFQDPEAYYILGVVYENLTIIFFVFQNVNNDSYPQCYLAVMIGHLRALAARISRIGKDTKMSDDANLTELLDCIQDHKNILGYFDCIRPVISRTLFMQFLITAFVLCTTAVKSMAYQGDATQLFITATYLIAVLVEVFPCCWFVNALIQESDYLTTALYSCNWHHQNRIFRRTLIIFMQRSQKSNVIMAGNLAPVTLQTFLAVIRFSFSMFTILSNMKI